MVEYRRSSHAVFRLRRHIVLITKYRKPVLKDEIPKEILKITREVCRTHDIEIVKGQIRPDHIHLLLDVPPDMAPSKVMQALKEMTSHRMLQYHRRLRIEFWRRHLWARGYFVATNGTVTDEAVAEYIEYQDAEPEDDGFKITHLAASHAAWTLGRLQPHADSTALRWLSLSTFGRKLSVVGGEKSIDVAARHTHGLSTS